MLCPEAGTNQAHRLALTRPGATAVTRAFSGRRARGIVNRFMRDHDAQAPSAYPQVNQLTSPLRAAARAARRSRRDQPLGRAGLSARRGSPGRRSDRTLEPAARAGLSAADRRSVTAAQARPARRWISSSLVQAPTEARTSPADGMLRTITPSRQAVRPRRRHRSGCQETSVERPRGGHLMPARAQQFGEPLGARRRRAHAPSPSRRPAKTLHRGQRPGAADRRGEAVVKAARRSASSEPSGSWGRPASRKPGNGGSSVVEPIRTHVERAAALRTAHPFLPRARVVVDSELMHVYWDRSKRLGGVEQHRDAGGAQGGDIHHLAADPGDVRARDQPGRRARPRPAVRRTARSAR